MRCLSEAAACTAAVRELHEVEEELSRQREQRVQVAAKHAKELELLSQRRRALFEALERPLVVLFKLLLKLDIASTWLRARFFSPSLKGLGRPSQREGLFHGDPAGWRKRLAAEKRPSATALQDS